MTCQHQRANYSGGGGETKTIYLKNPKMPTIFTKRNGKNIATMITTAGASRGGGGRKTGKLSTYKWLFT